MKVLSILLIIIACTLNVAKAQQQPNTDSLYAIWQNQEQDDLARLDALDALANYFYKDGKFDSVVILADKLLEYAQEVKSEKHIANAYLLKAQFFQVKNKVEESSLSLLKALEFYEKIDDKFSVGRCLSNLGANTIELGDLVKGEEYLLKGLEVLTEIDNKFGMSMTAIYLANSYRQKGDFGLAISYLDKAEQFARDSDNNKAIGTSFALKGVIYHSLNAYEIGNRCFEKAYRYHIKNNDIYSALFVKGNLADGLSNSKRYKESLDLYRKLEKELLEHGVFSLLPNIYLNVADIHIKLSNLDSAQVYFEKYKTFMASNHESEFKPDGFAYVVDGNILINNHSYSKAVERCRKPYYSKVSSQDIELKLAACNCLYSAFRKSKQADSAFFYLDKYAIIQDSLDVGKSRNELERQDAEAYLLKDSLDRIEKERVVNEKHQKEIEAKNKARNVAYVAGLFIVLIAISIYARLKYVHKAKKIIEKEKHRSDELLLNILPAEVAEELKNKGSAETKLIEQATVLFTDFKDFTSIAGGLSPIDVVTDLNVHFSEFDNIMKKYGIEKIKTIGDAYMAAGGLPTPNNTHAKDVVLAALEISKFVELEKQKHIEKQLPFFEIRIGIHTGPVVAGIVGIKKFQYDIWGDTVNTASRMESHGEVGKVNISEATYELIKDDALFSFEPREELEIKGKGKMQTYFVALAN